MELGLANKTALVTGGSKGIGLETARALAREGVKVLICARREAALADAARDISLTDYSSWGDAERIVINGVTLFREFAGGKPEMSIRANLFGLMAELRASRRQ